MWEPRVQALEERTGRIESKLDAVTVKLDLMAEQQAELRADMRAMAGDLRAEMTAQSESFRADLRAMAGDLRAEMTAQSESFRADMRAMSDRFEADMKAMAKDLKSVEISQADMCGQLRQMPSTWTMMTTFLAVSLALVTMIVGGIALLPALQAWMAPS
jgi:F0F1-type ATP synthase membrane subunit b/b'